MSDDRLVGAWSDENLYMGSMEAADITFRPDGTGWTYWSSAGGSFYVDRFEWMSTTPGHVDIKLRRSLFGWWIVRGAETHHRIESDKVDDRLWAVEYAISSGHDVFGNQVTLLEFDRKLSITHGRRFAFRSTVGTDDPTIIAGRRTRCQLRRRESPPPSRRSA